MHNLQNRRILVTGGVGFIGSHLCEALLRERAIVVALDNFDSFYPRSLKEQNAQIIASAGASVCEADVRNLDAVRECLRRHRPDTIVHFAARAGVRPSLEHPALYADVNVNGTAVLLMAARDAGIRRFVFASSSSVYGLHSSERFRETDNTDHPLSPYGATKKSGEVFCHAFHHLYSLSVACLRLFTVYGTRQRPDLAIRKFVALALTGQEIPVYGNGTSSRDYTHVSDVVSGVLGAIEWSSADSPRFDVFNLGSSNPVLLNDLLALIESELGRPLRLSYLPVQPGDVPYTFADSSKAGQHLGFRQTVDFRKGLRDFIRWMQQQ